MEAVALIKVFSSVAWHFIDLSAVIPRKIRANHGTELVDLYAVHCAFHEQSPAGEPGECFVYGRSVHNQKIECYRSQMCRQWSQRWRDLFDEMAAKDLIQNQELDRLALVYIFMPIIQSELEFVRRDYNAYPIRKNKFSDLPSGPPEDNYILPAGNTVDMAVDIDPSWIERVRRHRLLGFDVNTVIE
jgi:hypothetical protein